MKNISILKFINTKFLLITFLLSYICNISILAEDLCYSCDTTEKNCTINPSSIQKNVTCNFLTKVCYTKLDLLGRNERGCTEKYNCNNDLCIKCTTSLCNNKTLPQHRPVCYQCSGWNCRKPEDNNKPQLCEYYDPDAKHDCYTTNTPFNVTRGCFANAKSEDFECQDNYKPCFQNTCKNDNENKDKPCNNFPVKLEYKCYKCDSNSDSNCANEFKDSKFEDCSEKIGCYERFTNSVAWRGCASKLPKDVLKNCKDPNYKNCRHCDLALCNFQKISTASKFSYSYILWVVIFLSICN